MAGEDVELLGRDVVYDGHFRLDRYRLRHRQFAGGLGPVLTREVLERGMVAAVLPVDPGRDRVVLIEQFRPGAWAAGRSPWLLECVAGVIEPGETPEELARREALEEAGCVITDLVPIATFLTSPGATTETVHLFCGRVASDGVGGLHGLGTEGEDIRATDDTDLRGGGAARRGEDRQRQDDHRAAMARTAPCLPEAALAGSPSR